MMQRLHPKLTDQDRSRCARLLTAFICGDKTLVESVFEETAQADAAPGLVMAMADHACWVLEHTTPLPVDEEDDPRNQN